MILESSALEATSRFNDSGVTVCAKSCSEVQTNVKCAYRISINRKDIFVKRRIDPNYVSHLMIDLELQRRHRSIKVDSVQVVKEENLTVAFATIARLRTFSWLADLDDDHIPI